MKLYQTGNLAIGTPVVIDGETVPVVARVIVDISSNDAIRIPHGTTATRPSTANTALAHEYKGYMRYNSQLKQFEGYTGTHWQSLSLLIDQDRDTFISTESADGADEIVNVR